MRESIGGAWIYGLALTFILLFSCFLAIAINYSKVFRVKNELVSMVENYSGFTNQVVRYHCEEDDCKRENWGEVGGSLAIIKEYLSSSGYTTHGNCPKDSEPWYGFDDDGKLSENTTNVLFCAKRKEIKKNTYSYNVILFFDANLPIIGDVFKFKVNGETNDVIFPSENDYFNSL